MNIYEKVLTPEAEAESRDWRLNFGGCSCFNSAPCSSCTHPGHPLNQECDETAWMDDCLDFDAMADAAMQRINNSIAMSAARHFRENKLVFTQRHFIGQACRDIGNLDGSEKLKFKGWAQ